LSGFTYRDLIKLTLLAVASLVLKPTFRSAFAGLALSLHLPIGSLIGGMYMFWPVLAAGLFPRPGTALLFCFIQGILATLTGLTGKLGPLGLISYMLPGLVIEGWVRLFPSRNVCRYPALALAASATANATGALVHGILYFGPGNLVISTVVITSFISGTLGGVLACMLYGILSVRRILPGMSRHD